jgi:anti-sigma regulatory factor (Ser/Thr protein kinase)
LSASCTPLRPSAPAVGAGRFRHEALFYAGDEEFLSETAPFIEDGLQAGEPVLVAVGPQRRSLIEGALGSRREGLAFLDMRAVGRNPARIIPAWQHFLDTAAPGGESVRGIAEPIWPGRSPAELTECERHERLLNVAFDGGQAWSLLCPYDVEHLDDEVLEGAWRSHPLVAGARGTRASDRYLSACDGLGPFAGALPEPRAPVAQLDFASAHGLAPMRAWLGAWASAVQVSAEKAELLVFAVNELASNSVCYAGGRGSLRAWREDGTAICEVADRGHIEHPLTGRINPTPAQTSGRGLWLVHQLCDLAQIRSSAGGTAVRVHMSLG